MLINKICQETRREGSAERTASEINCGRKWERWWIPDGCAHEDAGKGYIKVMARLSPHVWRSMQRLRVGIVFGISCKYMHAHLPKTTMNRHWRKLKRTMNVSLDLASVTWSTPFYQAGLDTDEEEFLSLPALRGNKAWTKILHNFTSSWYHKAVGCSPFSCTVVVDFALS